MTPQAAGRAAHWDALVIGGGSAGCVMARRLCDNPSRRVLLLEAGPRLPADQARAVVRNGNQPAVMPGLNWKYRTAIKGEARPGASGGSVFDYEAGRLLGGSSAVNATQALRGTPQDHAEWAEACGEAWGWDAVLPVFRALEDDPLGPSELHGRGGPMPIRREAIDALAPLHGSLLQACLDAGFASTDDHNDPSGTGVGVIPRNVVDGVRVSAADAYLAPVASGSNLDIHCGVHVHRLLWDGTGRCTGVLADVDGELRTYHADKVILCAGVMSTPAILMRSGVGEPTALRDLQIPVELPLHGVGGHLMEHPVIGIWGAPRPGTCVRGEPLRQSLLRFTSGLSGHANDMHLCMMSGIDARAMFPHLASADEAAVVAGLTVCFNKPLSSGQVRLASADPRTPPIVSNNLLGHAEDAAPLRDAVKLGWDLLQRPALRDKFSRLLAWTDAMVRSPAALEQAVRSFVRPSAHGCGTARMGRSADAGAVVDPAGRLHGAQNVWVADASVFPSIPSAPPHLTCLMTAEKIAHGLA
jgi:choline dehydrogenase